MNREAYHAHPDATPYIGSASSRMYKFVRYELEVPFMSNKAISTLKDEESDFNWCKPEHDSKRGVTMGRMIATVYESMRTGHLYHHVVAYLSDVQDFSCAAEKALAINQDENTEFSYARFKSSELDDSSSNDSDSFSGDEKNSAAQAQNLSSTDTIVDHTLYHLNTEAKINPETKQEVDMAPNLAWQTQSLGFGAENNQIHSIV